MTSPIDVHGRMQILADRWEAKDDKRCIFLGCYTLMTGNMLAALDRDEFHDSPWVRQLLTHFAKYYFDALDAFERNDAATPAVWRVAHEAAATHRTMTLQHLFLGVNAHINFDLALTVVDMLENEWQHMPPEQRRKRYEDYCMVNEIIARTIDEVQDQVIRRHSPALGLVDALLGRLDERVIVHQIAKWREQVWEFAVSLLEFPRGERRDNIVALIEAMALERSDAILFREGLASFKHLT
jgi:hypothetical protein